MEEWKSVTFVSFLETGYDAGISFQYALTKLSNIVNEVIVKLNIN